MSGAMTVEMILRLVDQATAPLRGVVSEVQNLDKAAKDLGKGAASAGRPSAAGWVEQQREIKKAAESAKDYEKQLLGVERAMRAVTDAALARGLGHGAMDIVKGGAREGAAGEHSEVSLQTQGNSAEQIRAIQAKAAELSRTFRAFDQTQIETMLGDAKTFVGSLDHAMAAMPDILKLRTIQQGQHGHTSDAEFNALIKALEVGGAAADEAKMHERMETFAKIMNVFKETIHPEDFSSFYNQAGIAARTLSDRFMRGAGAHLMQEMGGGGAGNAVNMFLNALEAGTMQPKAMETMDKLGLLDAAKTRRRANGEIRWIDPGGVKGADVAKSDPDRWVDEVLRPALEKLAPEKRDEAELALFSNSSVRKLVDKVLNQKSVIDKDLAQVQAAPGLEAADAWGGKDPTLAAHAVGAQFENLLRDAGKPLMGAATGLMNWLAATEAALGKVAEEFPAAATAAGLTTAAAGFWASLKLAQSAMTKAAGWWGQGASGAAPATAAPATAAEAAATAAKAAPKGGALAETAKGFRDAVGGEEALAELGHNARWALGSGLVAGLVSMAADWGLKKAEEKLLGWTPENTAKAEQNIHAKAAQWWAGHDPSPTGAAKADPARELDDKAKALAPPKGEPLHELGAHAKELAPPVAPKVETKALDEAKDKADAAGKALRDGLDVTVTPKAETGPLDAAKTAADAAGVALKGLDISVEPKVDLSHIRQLNVEIIKALQGLTQLAAAAKGAPIEAAKSIRRGYQPGTHALHDGTELY